MKKLSLLFFALLLTLLPLKGGEEIKLQDKDFKLGEFSIAGGKFKVTADKGIYTVET